MFDYKRKRLQVWWNNKFNPKPKLEEQEELAKKVIIKLLSQPKTVYLMTPNFKYFIQTENKDYHILLGDGYMKLTNHNYVYEVRLKPKVASELIQLVRKAIDKSTNKMEQIILSNEINMLNEILNK